MTSKVQAAYSSSKQDDIAQTHCERSIACRMSRPWFTDPGQYWYVTAYFDVSARLLLGGLSSRGTFSVAFAMIKFTSGCTAFSSSAVTALGVRNLPSVKQRLGVAGRSHLRPDAFAGYACRKAESALSTLVLHIHPMVLRR